MFVTVAYFVTKLHFTEEDSGHVSQHFIAIFYFKLHLFELKSIFQ